MLVYRFHAAPPIPHELFRWAVEPGDNVEVEVLSLF
jgi:hypothetical protein